MRDLWVHMWPNVDQTNIVSTSFLCFFLSASVQHSQSHRCRIVVKIVAHQIHAQATFCRIYWVKRHQPHHHAMTSHQAKRYVSLNLNYTSASHTYIHTPYQFIFILFVLHICKYAKRATFVSLFSIVIDE